MGDPLKDNKLRLKRCFLFLPFDPIEEIKTLEKIFEKLKED
jgi:hypothetical protein